MKLVGLKKHVEFARLFDGRRAFSNRPTMTQTLLIERQGVYYGTENNNRYSRGPNASDVQRYTGRTVEPLRVSSTTDSRSTGVRNDELRVFRPTTSEASSRSTTAPENNRVSTPQTQTAQPATRATTPQRGTQTEQPATGTTTPQRSVQSDQSSETREYRPTQEQPPVTNRVAPQTTRQIQRAQSDNVSSQQQQQQVQSRQQSQPQQVQQEQEQQPTRRTTTSSPTRR